MSNRDNIEYYDGSSEYPLIRLDSSIVPAVGSQVSIRGVTWRVRFVSYAVDHSDKPMLTSHRANVTLERVK